VACTNHIDQRTHSTYSRSIFRGSKVALQRHSLIRMKRLRSAMNASGDESIETVSQLGSYPLLALLVRAIKYLGIYRHRCCQSTGKPR
jgi:hypothetical protein